VRRVGVRLDVPVAIGEGNPWSRSDRQSTLAGCACFAWGGFGAGERKCVGLGLLAAAEANSEVALFGPRRSLALLDPGFSEGLSSLGGRNGRCSCWIKNKNYGGIASATVIGCWRLLLSRAWNAGGSPKTNLSSN
jgi:hypothetical protein